MLPAKIAKAQNLFNAVPLVKADILTFMAKYPVHPPDGKLVVGHFTTKAPHVAGPVPTTDGYGQVKFSKQKLVNLVDRVAFLRCIDETSAGEAGALSFEVKYADELTTTVSRAGRAPAWWLPWNNSGALVKLTIEPSTTPTLNFGPGIANQANPNMFFTAAINGCSVFAYGSLDGPSVYHAGLGGDVLASLGASAAGLGTTSEEAWENLLNHVTFSGSNIAPAVGNRKQNKPNFSSVDKSEYVAERKGHGFYTTKGLPNALGKRLDGRTTKRARDFQNWVESHPANGVLPLTFMRRQALQVGVDDRLCQHALHHLARLGIGQPRAQRLDAAS